MINTVVRIDDNANTEGEASMTTVIDCFKAYDVRGRVPEELNVNIAYRIARAFAEFLSPKIVVVGFDIRLTSRELNDALIRGV